MMSHLQGVRQLLRGRPCAAVLLTLCKSVFGNQDALARNQERKTGSKRKQQGNKSGESCSSAKKAIK